MVMAARETVGREASPSASVIDRQSVKTTESGGPWRFGEGRPWPLRGRVSAPNGEQIKGRKSVRLLSRASGVRRLTVTDPLGLMVGAEVHQA
jgi:hypothetical protein